MSVTQNSTTFDDKAAAATKQYGPLDVNALNLPNCITVSRLVLAFVLFGMISYGGLWIASAVVFAVAAATDAVDGYLARRYGMVTTLGRILDPFVDKIIVCGAFIFLLAVNDPAAGVLSGIGPWMTLVIIGREMFITGLRSILEQQGKDFSASMSGKIKMVVQCFAVEATLLSLSPAFKSVWLIGLPRFAVVAGRRLYTGERCPLYPPRSPSPPVCLARPTAHPRCLSFIPILRLIIICVTLPIKVTGLTARTLRLQQILPNARQQGAESQDGIETATPCGVFCCTDRLDCKRPAVRPLDRSAGRIGFADCLCDGPSSICTSGRQRNGIQPRCAAIRSDGNRTAIGRNAIGFVHVPQLTRTRSVPANAAGCANGPQREHGVHGSGQLHVRSIWSARPQ